MRYPFLRPSGDGDDLKMVSERRGRALHSDAGPADVLPGLVAVGDDHRPLKSLVRHPARLVADDRALDATALRELKRDLQGLRQVAVAPVRVDGVVDELAEGLRKAVAGRANDLDELRAWNDADAFPHLRSSGGLAFLEVVSIQKHDRVF